MQEVQVRFNLCGDVDQIGFCETYLGPAGSPGGSSVFARRDDLPFGGYIGPSFRSSFGDLLETDPTHEGALLIDRDGWSSGHSEAAEVVSGIVVGLRCDPGICAAAFGDLEEIIWVLWNEDQTVVANLDPSEGWAYAENAELAVKFYIPAIRRALSAQGVAFSERHFGPDWADA